jgi:hypothetical protein
LSYIGKTPTVGNFIKLDDISTSSTNSYTLQHNSVNFSPESALHMMVSLNGVVQAPNTSYTVSGSTITFLPSSGTLSSSDSIDFIMVYGNVLDVGVASSVADSSVTKGKLNLISDSSSAGLTIKGDGGSENGTLQLNCSQNSHGVKISSPAHSSGQSYELILPTGNVTADRFLKVASVSGSGATGIGQLSFAEADGGTNTPNFSAYLGSNTSLANTTTFTVPMNTERWDTASAFNTSDYSFTVPSGQGGKYNMTFKYLLSGAFVSRIVGYFVVNGSDVAGMQMQHNSTDTSFIINANLNLSASDVVRVSAYQDSGSSRTLLGGTTFSEFSGFKIIE